MITDKRLRQLSVRYSLAAMFLTLGLALNASAQSIESLRFDWGGNFQRRVLNPIDKTVRVPGMPLIEVVEHNPFDPMAGRITLALKNVHLKTFLDMVGEQARIQFILPRDLPNERVSVEMDNVTVRFAVEKTLELEGLAYRKIDVAHSYLIVRDPLATKINLAVVNVTLRELFVRIAQQTRASFRIEDSVPRFKLTVKINEVKALDIVQKILEGGELLMERREDAKTFVISK